MNEQIHIFRRRVAPIVRRLCSLLLALFIVPNVHAQLALPTLPALPNTQGVQQAPQQTFDTVARQLNAVVVDASSEVNTQAQRLLRAARIRDLLRANTDILEADPNGEPILRNQVVSLAPTPAGLQAAIAASFSIIQDQTLDSLGMRIVTLQAPAGMTTRRALQQLRTLDRNGSYDYNHVYTQSASAEPTNVKSSEKPIAPSIGKPIEKPIADARVGLIDAGVATQHPVFRGNQIHTWGCDQQLIPTAHGTAVASLLVGRNEQFSGAAPGATLYAADVYCGQPIGGSMTRIAAALAWLAEQQVPVINISLVGPDNVLLKQLVHNLIARGHIIVAAVGNDGPAAAPLYPASYPDVVGVTAVDAKDHVLIEAGRGKQVDFAAPGADMAAAVLTDSYAAVRGTSFAAPLVAGLLAAHIKTPQPEAATQAIAMLASTAHDLGSRGVDKTFGNGVVGESLRVALTGLPIKADKAAAIIDAH